MFCYACGLCLVIKVKGIFGIFKEDIYRARRGDCYFSLTVAVINRQKFLRSAGTFLLARHLCCPTTHPGFILFSNTFPLFSVLD